MLQLSIKLSIAFSEILHTYRAVSQGPYNEFTTNSILSRKRKSERENAFSTSLGLLDGDDEGSLAETDFS